MERRKLLSMLLCLAAVAASLYSLACTKQNALGRKSVSFVPASLLTSQAKTFFEEEKKKKPISQNQRWQEITQRVGDRLIAVAQENYGQYCRGFQWEVVLFRAPETKNAYCAPGGKIGIYSGILPVCETEAGLAAVMGHEIAHALLNHGQERASQEMGSSVLLLGAQKYMEKKDIDSSSRKKILVALGLGAKFGLVLPYSRRHEHEADRMGLRLMALAGYEPSEAPNLWRRMQALSGAQIPEFFSTHPSSGNRVRRLERLQGEVQPLYEDSPIKYETGELL